jgi:hypothetical protein
MFSPARLAFVLETMVEWKGSGLDSGPLTERFFVILLRPAADPLTVIYPIAGVSRRDFTGGWGRGISADRDQLRDKKA